MGEVPNNFSRCNTLRMRSRRRPGACCHDHWHHWHHWDHCDHQSREDAAAFADKGTCCRVKVPAATVPTVGAVTVPMVGAATVSWIGGLVGRFGLQI